MSKVVYDGECSVCTTLKDFAEDKLQDQEIEFIPFQSSDFDQVAFNLTRQEAEQSLYVFSEDQKPLKGARAVFEIMSGLPGFWGFIGKILRQPPFYWVAEPFYRLFAKHRH